METMVSKCFLRAPFSGRLAKLHVEDFQYVTPGEPLMDIIDTTNLEVRLIVPSRWLVWLRSGSNFSLAIEKTGRYYKARVSNINPKVDPLSQSVSIMAEIVSPHSELLPGMSDWANFKR